MWHCTLPDFHLSLLENNSFPIMSAMKDSNPSRIKIKRIEIIKCLLAKDNEMKLKSITKKNFGNPQMNKT